MKINQLKCGVILNYVIIILQISVALLYTPYMLRMLGQQEFGLYSLVGSLIAYLTILDLGFGNAIIRFTAKFRALKQEQKLYKMLGTFVKLYVGISILSVIAGFFLFYYADYMFDQTMSPEEIGKAKIMIGLLILNLAFTFPLSIFGGVITAYEDFIFIRIVSILRILMTTVLMVFLLRIGYKAITMVIVNSVFNIFILLINCIYCLKKYKIKIIFGKIDKSLLLEMFGYSFWVFLNIIMDKIYWATGQFVIGVYLGSAMIAIYAIAIQFQNLYMHFSTAISSVLLPRFSSIVALGDNNKLISEMFTKVGRIQYIIVGLILVGFIAVGDCFILLWAGNEYKEAYPITIIFFTSLIIPLIQNSGIAILQARNKLKFRSISFIIIAIISLILQIITTKFFGIFGCCLSVSISLIIGQGIIMNIYYQRVHKIDILHFWKEILKMSFVPISLMVLFIFIKNWIPIDSWSKFFICTVLFILLYSILSFFVSMNNFEKNIVKSFTKKFINLLQKKHV